MISMEPACPSSPSVLAACSSLKSSLMKDGSPKACGVPLTSASPVKSFLLGPQARGFLSPFRSGSAVIRVSVFA
uniref:Uncharacterized protein n=1 Tax=Rangifer tarandus platyrhynchus TaxID=3082113 RepID=A0ACB0EJN7_RANTA|nr:unnamed protein product [Rangifer tarandus platyrhynchus]